MQSVLFCIEGTDLYKRRRVLRSLGLCNYVNVTNIDFKIPAIYPNYKSIADSLLNSTFYISQNITKESGRAFITFDYLLPHLIAYYFYSHEDIIGLYGLLEKLKNDHVFTIPKYIIYLPYKSQQEHTFGSNMFSNKLRIAKKGHKNLKLHFEYASWVCLEAMQRVFSDCVYFDIYNNSKKSLTYPVKTVVKGVWDSDRSFTM